jgi:hypothetical protein
VAPPAIAILPPWHRRKSAASASAHGGRAPAPWQKESFCGSPLLLRAASLASFACIIALRERMAPAGRNGSVPTGRATAEALVETLSNKNLAGQGTLDPCSNTHSNGRTIKGRERIKGSWTASREPRSSCQQKGLLTLLSSTTLSNDRALRFLRTTLFQLMTRSCEEKHSDVSQMHFS